MKVLLLAALLAQQPTPDTMGVVSGTILYSDGTPATKIGVRLLPVPEAGQPSSPGRAPVAFTDPKGNYTRSVAAGRYIIQTLADNPTFYPGVLIQSAATVVVVTAGSVNSGLNFSLPPSASGVRLQGRVVLPVGYPAPASTLRVVKSGESADGPISADGTFEFTHVMPGVYPLSISAPGAQPVTVTVANQDIAGVELRVPPLIPVQGVVSVDVAGPRPALKVLLESFLPAVAGTPVETHRVSLTPLANGSFSTSLPPGEYRVAATNLPAGYYIKEITANSQDLFGTSLKIEESGPAARVSLVVGTSSGVRVAGRVTRADNDRTTSVPQKILFTGTSGEVLETSVGPDGGFEFLKLLPGNYHARIMVSSTVSSRPTRVVVPNRNVSKLEISLPGTRELFGKVAVEGGGPPPRFALLLTRDPKMGTEGRQGELPSVPASTLMTSVAAGSDSTLKLDVDALPDGSFVVRIPDGDYRVLALPAGLPQESSGIPPAYFIRSLTSGSADLMTQPLSVSEKERPEIHIGFGTTSPNPWVRVSGRVTGQNANQGGLKVLLDSNVTSGIEAFVDAEGKFEFPVVLKHTRYVARLLPNDDAASTPPIHIEDKDVTDVEIFAPARREVTTRVIVEGNNVPPIVGLSLNAKDRTMVVVIKPEVDGTTKINLPIDERTVRVRGLPLGYDVKSLSYGSTDLMKRPLNIAASMSSELRITLAVDPEVPSGSVRGRVTGLDPESGSVRLVLNGVTAFAQYEVAVNADGSFNFPRLPQGTYIPALEGGAVVSLTPGSVTITGTELAGVELAAKASGATPPADSSKGATLADFGGSAASEFTAIANLRTINTALITFLSAAGGRYGSLEDLIGAGLLDTSFRSTKAGFTYSVITTGSDYAAAAVPAGTTPGQYGYYSVPDAVIRYSTFDKLAPPQQASAPVQ